MNSVQIVTSIAVPFASAIAAVVIAFGLNRREQHRRNVRETFYSLKLHVDRFKLALYYLINHAMRFEIAVRTMERLEREMTDPKKTGDQKDGMARERHRIWQDNTEESIKLTEMGRETLSVLNADKAMLKMLYNTDLRHALLESLDELTVLMPRFLPTQKGGRQVDYQEVKEISVDDLVERIHEEIDALWAKTIYPAAISEF